MDSTASFHAPRNAATMSAPSETVTGFVVIAKVLLVAPSGTVTKRGTLAAEGLDELEPEAPSATSAPFAGAGPLSLTVPCATLPPTTGAGLSVREKRRGKLWPQPRRASPDATPCRRGTLRTRAAGGRVAHRRRPWLRRHTLPGGATAGKGRGREPAVENSTMPAMARIRVGDSQPRAGRWPSPARHRRPPRPDRGGRRADRRRSL
jgi:hypothetical protein